ncbi:hypothetical protein EDB87DRAFT_1818898 [Lactarius vividus]|nr:hypothetical protein EDB87DRAFT_1818898 [Lactarius vividus]
MGQLGGSGPSAEINDFPGRTTKCLENRRPRSELGTMTTRGGLTQRDTIACRSILTRTTPMSAQSYTPTLRSDEVSSEASTNDIASDTQFIRNSSKNQKFTREMPRAYERMVVITRNDSFTVQAFEDREQHDQPSDTIQMNVSLPSMSDTSEAELKHTYRWPMREEALDFQAFGNVKIHPWNETKDSPITQKDPRQKDQHPRHMQDRGRDRHESEDTDQRVVQYTDPRPTKETAAYLGPDVSRRFLKSDTIEVMNLTRIRRESAYLTKTTYDDSPSRSERIKSVANGPG